MPLTKLTLAISSSDRRINPKWSVNPVPFPPGYFWDCYAPRPHAICHLVVFATSFLLPPPSFLVGFSGTFKLRPERTRDDWECAYWDFAIAARRADKSGVVTLWRGVAWRGRCHSSCVGTERAVTFWWTAVAPARLSSARSASAPAPDPLNQRRFG